MPRHPYAGGFREDVKAQLERIQVPEKVKCKTCKKIRMQNAFSKRQLEELRNAMLYGATSMDGPGYAKCRNCVGGQTVELTCIICDKTKGLEHFSKNQRSDPDNARCVNCVQGSLDIDPFQGKGKEDASYMSTTESHYDGDTITNPLSRPALNNDMLGSGVRTPVGHRSASHTKATASELSDSDSDHGDETGNLTTGVWLSQGARIKAEREAREKMLREQNEAASRQNASIPFTGFDPKGVPHARQVAPSVADSTGLSGEGWKRWESTREPRPASNASALTGGKGNAGFAKIKGTRFPKDEAPVMHVPEPDGQVVESDDDDGDDEFHAEEWI